jgi:hypothetical protein
LPLVGAVVSSCMAPVPMGGPAVTLRLKPQFALELVEDVSEFDGGGGGVSSPS